MTESQAAPADRPGVSQRRAAILATLGLVWLAAVLWAGWSTIGSGGTGSAVELATAQAAIVLPTLVAAAALAAAAAALLATVVAPVAARTPAVRATAGALTGVLAALAGAGAVLGGYQGRPMVTTIAVTIAVGAAAAGVLVALVCTLPGAGGRPAGAAPGTGARVPGPGPGARVPDSRPGAAGRAAAVAAGLVGALAVLVVGFLRGAFEGRLVVAISSGDSLGDNLRATLWVEYTVSLLSGLVAGAIAHWYLRRHATTRRQLPYALAGALPGVLLLVAEAATRSTGARLLDAAANASAFDTAVMAYLANGRLNHGLIAFFVGALTALVLLGRSLGPRQVPGPNPAAPAAASSTTPVAGTTPPASTTTPDTGTTPPASTTTPDAGTTGAAEAGRVS